MTSIFSALRAWLRHWQRRRILRARRAALPDPFKN